MRTAQSRVLGLLGLALLLPLQARAEDEKTNGFKVGDGRLHPFFELDTRYDSAGGYFAGTVADLQVASEVISHIRPGIRYDLSSPSTQVDFQGALDYVLYTGVVSPNSRSASRLHGDATLAAHFNREGQVGVKLSDRFARTDQTQNIALAIGVLSLQNEARAELPIRPGGGALEIVPSAAWSFELVDAISTLEVPGCSPSDPTCSASSVSGMNYNNFQFALNNRWRFLPKTAVVLNGTFDLRNYVSGSTNQLIKAQTGLAGLISTKVSVIALFGWAYDLALPSVNTPIGQLEATYLTSETIWFKAGYLRTVVPVALYGDYTDDRGYAEANAQFFGKLALHARGSVDFLTFYRPENSTLTDRSDLVFGLDAGPTYEFTPWFTVAGGYALTVRSSSSSIEGLNFPRHEGYVRLNFSY